MDPQYEQRLRDEVIYLHSLWHQGPPSPAAAAAAAAAASPSARHHLQPTNGTQFKRIRERRGKKNKKTTANSDTAAPEPIPSPGIEWKCPTPPPPSSTGGWPSSVEKPDPNPLPFSPEDQSKLAASHAHHHAIKVVHEFFRCNTNNDDDDSDAIDSSSDGDEDDLMDEDCGREEYSFFFKVFKEDSELREYYEKNFAKGVFSCLVCVAIGGKKMGKKYTGCVALVQHSITIAKTKKKRSHRAFALAVCKVLSWDIDKLPTIVSLLSDKSGKTEGNGNSDNKESSRTVNNVDSVENGTLEGKSDNAVQESGPVVTGILSNGDDESVNSLACPSPEWKCPTPPPPASTSGWPSSIAKLDPKPVPISSEDQLKLAARHAHQHAIKVVHEFFRCNNDDDSDATDCSSDEDDDSMDEDCGRDEYSFFFKVFKEDSELREYYKKNFVKGEFSCLVCGAIGGKKMGKKYTGCLALVQHSITIAKTKKKRAHKAFALAVCKVLSWDIDQLPTIVSLLSDKSGESEGNGNSDNKESSRTSNNVDSVEDDIVEGKSDNVLQESGPVITGILSKSDDGYTNSLTCPDASKNLEDIDMIHPHKEDLTAEGLASNSFTCSDASKNLEDIGVIHPHKQEEPAAEDLTSNCLECPDFNKNLENHGMVCPDNVDEPASERLAINSLASPDADKNLDSLGMVYQHNIEEPTSEGLVVVPRDENITVGDEKQDLQMGNVCTDILTELNKGDED